MTKLLFKHLLFSYVFSVSISIILLLCIYQPNLNTYDGGQFFLIALAGSFYMNLLLTLSATTTFLNLYKWIRENIVLRLLSFFLLSIVLSLFWFVSMNEPFFNVIVLCFVIVRVYIYICFTKHLRRQ